MTPKAQQAKAAQDKAKARWDARALEISRLGKGTKNHVPCLSCGFDLSLCRCPAALSAIQQLLKDFGHSLTTPYHNLLVRRAAALIDLRLAN